MPNKTQSNIDKFSTAFTLKSGSKILDLNNAAVMGIINLTPDSFYAGSRHQSEKELLEKAEQHLQQGASIIDIGAVSTRPGAIEVSFEDEQSRLLSSLKTLRKHFPDTWISVDTWRSEIAKQCIDEGADMINDISGGSFDEGMAEIIGESNTPYVLMHIQGKPENMQDNPQYYNIIFEIRLFFEKQLKRFEEKGAKQIILDPGFGFGKTMEQNYHLLRNIDQFKQLEQPLLVGISRKSMIHKLLQIKAKHALNGTTSLNTLALLNGTNILRVHDVKEAMEAIKLVEMYQTS